MISLRVVVFAYSEVGAACLEELLSLGAHVVALYTHEDDPTEEIWFRTPAPIARAVGIPVFSPQNVNDPDEVEKIRNLAPDLFFSFYYRNLIGKTLLDLPRLGAYNMHGSLLPKYRGRVPINWAIINGETETGVTLHRMTLKADAGEIIDAERVPIHFEDTAKDVFMRVAEAARIVLRRAYPAIASGTAKGTPQDESLATTFGRRRPEDGRIDWTLPAVRIYNLIRAVTHPYPGAFTTIEGKKFFIWKAFPIENPETEAGVAEGTVLSENPFLVKTASGVLEVLSAQIEGQEEAEGSKIAEALHLEGKHLGM